MYQNGHVAWHAFNILMLMQSALTVAGCNLSVNAKLEEEELYKLKHGSDVDKC